MNRFRPYTGDIAYAAGMLSSAAVLLKQEATMLEQRLWTEDQAEKLVTSWLGQIHADIATAQKAVKDIEDTLTTVQEEQSECAA